MMMLYLGVYNIGRSEIYNIDSTKKEVKWNYAVLKYLPFSWRGKILILGTLWKVDAYRNP